MNVSYDEFLKKFGIRVKYLRLMKNMTQDKLAEILKVDTHYLSDIERGRRNISMKTMYKIFSALEVEPGVLFNFEK